MDNMLVVEVVKCGNKDWWYSKLIGFELNVMPYDGMDYALYCNPTLLIYKGDVKIVGKL